MVFSKVTQQNEHNCMDYRYERPDDAADIIAKPEKVESKTLKLDCKEGLLILDRQCYEDLQKSLHDWRNILCVYWPLLVQAIFIIAFIVVICPWIRQVYNDEASAAYESHGILWNTPFMYAENAETVKAAGPESRVACGYRSCFAWKSLQVRPLRKASFLKRKRTPKEPPRS
ncbi:uncharacterized protein LOC105703154 [Orussus abietinus]|uniref:uncharacterized protein LOC105703154 n=1 Tax=Orussus abietinus TaxID=222816 RepID=UPI0006263E76|nr:uncharacterized protein LOC105703154 [Orussus abietinus]